MYLSKQLKSDYDIIVVGAGPAGSMAAREAARRKVEVLILEKDREVGTPVRCAEGVAKKDLERILEHSVLPGWVASEISKFRLFSPNGTPVYINIDEIGYVLNRRLFDYDLALQAVGEGAQLLTHAEVYSVLHTHGKISGVKVRLAGKEEEITTPKKVKGLAKMCRELKSQGKQDEEIVQEVKKKYIESGKSEKEANSKAKSWVKHMVWDLG